jgi:predicted site-specific integrase-resolvase
MDISAGQQYVSINDLATRLDVHPLTIRLWIKKGLIKTVQPGGRKGRHRIPITEVQRLEQRTTTKNTVAAM